MEVAYLLLNGSLPDKKQLEAFTTQVTEARKVPAHIYDCFKKWPKDSNPMDVLQATVPMLAMVDPDLQNETGDANFRMATRLIARLPVVVADWHRLRNGQEPLSSDDALAHAANFLWLLQGKNPMRRWHMTWTPA